MKFNLKTPLLMIVLVLGAGFWHDMTAGDRKHKSSSPGNGRPGSNRPTSSTGSRPTSPTARTGSQASSPTSPVSHSQLSLRSFSSRPNSAGSRPGSESPRPSSASSSGSALRPGSPNSAVTQVKTVDPDSRIKELFSMASEKNGILSADEKNELIQLTSKALNDYLQITPNANFEDQNFLNLYNKAMSAKFISGLKAQQSPAHPKTPRVQVETISHPQQPPAGATPKPETSRLQRRRPAAAKSPAGATTGELALGTLIVRPAN